MELNFLRLMMRTEVVSEKLEARQFLTDMADHPKKASVQFHV